MKGMRALKRSINVQLALQFDLSQSLYSERRAATFLRNDRKQREIIENRSTIYQDAMILRRGKSLYGLL